MIGNKALVTVEHLKKVFPLKAHIFRPAKSYVHAVDDVSLSLPEGETFGLAGESGCGKSTLGRLLLRLLKPTEGRIYFNGTDLLSLSSGEMRRMRKLAGIVFQDPKSSLNPKMTIFNTLKRPLEIHGVEQSKQGLSERVLETLEAVGLGAEHLNTYPYDLSGGQQQRVNVARAIITRPKFVILDEPTSSLDISVQAQILNLLVKLEKQFDLTYLFISHDLAVLQYISDRLGIMYLGKIMEILDSNDFRRGIIHHPYTAYLILSKPTLNPRLRSSQEAVLKGDVPSPINPPKGCRFHPRCPFADEVCRKNDPALFETETNHFVKCHFPERTGAELLPLIKRKLEMYGTLRQEKKSNST